jgi:hypothetical protein
VSKPSQVIVQVTGQPPLETVPALFGNFVGISRVGHDVQFEFIYVDLNQMASMLQEAEKSGNQGPLEPIVGKTVVKVVMPAEAFVQMQTHVEKLFAAIKADLKKNDHGEEDDVRKRVNS